MLAASTEIGQGTNTVFSQIAADALGISYDRIQIAQPDTGAVPNSGPTVASRTSMVVGALVEIGGALEIKRKPLMDSGLLACDACTEDGIRARLPANYIETSRAAAARAAQIRSAARDSFWDDKKYSGEAPTAPYAWAVYVAEVAVDTVTTFEARVSRFRRAAGNRQSN